MQLKNRFLILSLFVCTSCLSQEVHTTKVVPILILSTKEQHSSMALIVQTINNSNNCYIFTGGYAFGKYLQISRYDSIKGWEEVVHPSIIELEERSKINSKNQTFTSYKRDYNTKSPLFEDWVSEDKNFIQGELQHLDLTLNNDIVESGAIEKLKECSSPSFSLFFVNRKSVYEQFWNMDFLLNNSGKYRISFIPDNLTKPCEFSFKEFELVSNDRVKFDSIEIIIK